MSHELTLRADGTYEAAFARNTTAASRWHGLGQDIDADASIEQWQAAAGMDWRIQRSAVRFSTSLGQEAESWSIMEDKHVLLRSDTRAPLGIVGAKYKALQPRDALEFFRDLVGMQGYKLNSAGTMFGGKRYWALAGIGESATFRSEADRMEGYLLLATSADGSMATTVRETTVCVVCNNTLTAALSDKARHEVRVLHRSEFDPEKVKDELGLARGNFAKFALGMRDLSAARLSADDAAQLTARLLSPAATGAAASVEAIAAQAAAMQKVSESKRFQKIMGLFSGDGMGAQLAGREGTFWGWVNAVTEYVDHHAPAKNESRRMNSAWFGDGDDLKTAAVELALGTI